MEINQGPLASTAAVLIGAKDRKARGWASYHEAVMRAYGKARNIGDRNVLADIAESIGLACDEYLTALDDHFLMPKSRPISISPTPTASTACPP